MVKTDDLANTVAALSSDQKDALLTQLVQDVSERNGLHEVPLRDGEGNVRGYFVPAARRCLLKEDTEFIEEIKRRAESPGKLMTLDELLDYLHSLEK